MAYQPYQYNGYQQTPYYQQPLQDQLAQFRQNQMQQPTMPVAQPMLNAIGQTPQASQGIVWVSGKSEADSYFVTPNSAVALWDANNPVIYLRKADSTGKPSTVVYDLVERTDSPPVHAAPQIDVERFVTWDKLDEYLSERLKRPSKVTQKKEDTE